MSTQATRTTTRILFRAQAFFALWCCAQPSPQATPHRAAPVRAVDTGPVELGLREGWSNISATMCPGPPLRHIALSVEDRAQGILLLRLRALDDFPLVLQHDYVEAFGWRPGEELHLASRLAASMYYPWGEDGEPPHVWLDVRDVGANAFELEQLQKQLSRESVWLGLMPDEHSEYQQSIAHASPDSP